MNLHPRSLPYVFAGVPWSVRFWRAAALVGVGAVVGVLAHGVRSEAAQDRAAGPECTLRTLHGAYGLVADGVRGLGPGSSESFTTVSMVTYDGAGTFTAIGVSHGAVTGVRDAGLVTGTYFVNPDCTGGEITFLPGLPALEDRFVIVDDGREVRTAVIAPATTIGTANLRKR